MSRALVTGATGFTARYVVPELERAGFEVWGVSRSIAPGPRSLRADVTDARAIGEAVAHAQPTHVVHLAGTSNLPDSEAETLFRVNVEGTRHLLDACARLSEPPQKILLASSGYVYGDTGEAPATEDRAPAPIGEYGRSKLEMERTAASWAARMPILVLRPFNYTGVGHDAQFLVPKLVRAYKERRATINFLDSEVRRDFSDVRWIAAVYATLLRSAAKPWCLNVCSGSGLPLLALADLLRGLTGHAPAIVADPAPSARSAIRVLVGSTARLEALSLRRSAISIEDTLRWMMEA